MNETHETELAYWQSRVDEMQVALERLREERDMARNLAAVLSDEIHQKDSIISRLQVALTQGAEL
jgi:hypothetical protein